MVKSRTSQGTPLSRAVPVEEPFAAIHDMMGPYGFGVEALPRLRAASALDEGQRANIAPRLEWRDTRSGRRFPWQPHATGAVNAWALLILPGPGQGEDPWELSYDWSPGWGLPATHLADFPAYTANTVPRAGHTWNQIRRVLCDTPIPGVRRNLDRLAAWGVANLSATHAPDEQTRALETHERRVNRARWVLGTCRPVVVAVPPGAGNRDLSIVADALRQLGLEPTDNGRTWSWVNEAQTVTRRLSALIWQGDSWSTGLIRLNQHPSKWGSPIGYPAGISHAIRWISSQVATSRLQ